MQCPHRHLPVLQLLPEHEQNMKRTYTKQSRRGVGGVGRRTRGEEWREEKRNGEEVRESNRTAQQDGE